MTMLRRESRASLNNPAIPISSASIVQYIGGGQTTDSGVSVNEFSSLTVGAMWRGASLLSGTVASMPLQVYTMQGKSRVVEDYPLLIEPYPSLSDFDWMRLTFLHRLLWGNAYSLKVPSELGDQYVRLMPLMPWTVTPRRASRSSDPAPIGAKLYDVTTRPGDPLTDREIIHFPGMGYDGVKGLSLVAHMRQTLGLALASEKSASKFYGSGSQVGGVLKINRPLKPDQAKATLTRWEEAHSGLARAHEVAVLDSGMDFQQLTMPMDDAQFLQSREFSVTEIARWLGVPPHLIGDVDRSTSWGTGIAEQSLGLHRYNLGIDMVATEKRFGIGLLNDFLPAGAPRKHARFDTTELLRGDFAARMAGYATAREIGLRSVNECRHDEGWDPVEGGDDYTPLGPTVKPNAGLAPDTGKTPKGV